MESSQKTSASRRDESNFVPQKENFYNKFLPYADKLGKESYRLFSDIKTNLVKAVLAKELRPGVRVWTSNLNKYLKVYGLKFSKRDHVCLVKLYYELLTLPDIDPRGLDEFASMLQQLLKYRRRTDELQLEWRPLYDLCVRVMDKSKSPIGMYRYSSVLENVLESVVRASRIYFPVTATQEILDEFRPMLCPYQSSKLVSTMEYLDMFLPVIVKPSEAHLGYNLWFEELMTFWEVCHNANNWESHIAWLMARLAHFNIGYINWEPYVPIMFVRFTLTLNLPVYFRQQTTEKVHKIDISAMTLWIVSILGGESDVAFRYLEQFMQTLGSYFYPANTGRWTMRLREFLKKLALQFVLRVHAERYKKVTWDRFTRESHKLSDGDIERFVNILKPCVEQAMFSKNGSQDIVLTLNYLASLRPDLIVPMTLDKLYTFMDSLVDPHKLTSSMNCVMAVSRYMVQGSSRNYPEGPTHVIPLMIAVLPGIDPNDMKKCFATFNLIVHFCALCPLVNSSEASKYYDDLTEEEHIVCEATASLEDFVAQFFDRLCIWIESNSLEYTRLELQDNKDFKSQIDILTESALINVITTVLTQCSREIFMTALRKVYKFVTTRIMELNISGRLLGFMCHAFVKINPSETMKLFVPYLCTTIEMLLDEHDDMLNEERVNEELLYNMLLLSEVVDGRDEVLPYVERVTKILDKTLHMKSVNGSKISAHLLNSIVTSLSFTQPKEYRSVNHSFDVPIQEFLPVRSWGCAGNLNDLNIQWYTPQEKEVECVQNLLNNYLTPELERLRRFSSGDLKMSREELHCCLKIVIACLGAETLLPMWTDPPLQLVDSCLEPWSLELIVGHPHAVTMPDGQNFRKVVAETIHRVQKRIQDTDEGDTISLCSVIAIYDIVVFNKYRGHNFELHWKAFHCTKKTLEDKLHQKKMHLRHILIDRIMLHQEFRSENRSCVFTEIHKQILLALFELSISRYSVVRIMAQSKLFSVVSSFPYSYTILTPHIKRVLQCDTAEHHEMFKGCLHVLGPRMSVFAAKYDWDFLNEIWPMIVQSKPSEKHSIINLMNVFSDTTTKLYSTTAIIVKWSDSCTRAALALTRNKPLVDLQDFESIAKGSVEALRKSNEKRLHDYVRLTNSLLEISMNGNLHWRYHILNLGLLLCLVHPDSKYSPSAVRYFLKLMVDETLRVRRIAMKVVQFILLQNKPKFKKFSVDPYQHYVKSADRIFPGNRPDNEWLLYNSSTVPTNSVEWNRQRYMHDKHTGFYTWPKCIQIYAPPNEQPFFEQRKEKLTEQELEIYNFFMDKANVALLIKYWSMEEKKGKDKFNLVRYSVIKNAFKILEDGPLELFIPHLRELVSDSQEHNHRCASEIISGIVKGSKHWSFEKVECLWTAVIPLLSVVFNNITSEMFVDWGVGISLCVESRDPNSVHWLIEYLMDDPLPEQSSFVACTRIFAVQVAINQQSWRNCELMNRLFTCYKEHLSHQFQSVRDQISSGLVSFFGKDIVFPGGNVTNCPRVSDFFAEIAPVLNDLYDQSLDGLSHSSEYVNSDNGVKIYTERVHPEKTKNIRLFKTVCKYVTNSICRVNYSAVTEHYNLLPLACVFITDPDEELSHVCSNYIAALGCTILLEKYITSALRIIADICACPFWSARAVIAEFIPVVLFHNRAIFMSKQEWVMEIQEIVLKLLEDVKPEVRIKAGKMLSGLLHCKFLPDPMHLLSLFKQKAKTKLKKSKTPDQQGTNGLGHSINVRHAGVLGLCAFISAHPYDVPDHMPEVFAELAPHLNDPQPIPATIRKTLGDFKRTHHDNWEVHKLQFSDKELLVLNDLTVPPPHYI